MPEKKTEGETTPQGAGGEAAAKEDITKMEAVRRSLEKLSKDAGLKAIQADVKERFGIDMTTDHIKTAKSKILNPKPKKAGRKTKASKPEPKVVPAQEPTPLPAPAESGNGKSAEVDMADILALRGLLDRVGADHLKALIDVMSR